MMTGQRQNTAARGMIGYVRGKYGCSGTAGYMYAGMYSGQVADADASSTSYGLENQTIGWLRLPTVLFKADENQPFRLLEFIRLLNERTLLKLNHRSGCLSSCSHAVMGFPLFNARTVTRGSASFDLICLCKFSRRVGIDDFQRKQSSLRIDLICISRLPSEWD